MSEICAGSGTRKALQLGLAVTVAWAAIVGLTALADPARAQAYVATEDPAHPRVRYPDAQLSINDRCPVRKTPLSLGVSPTYVNGLPLGYCCHDCRAKLVLGPEKYLKGIHVSVRSVVDTSRAAVIDSTYRRMVGEDFYFFADQDEMKRFDKDPLRYVNAAVDPVTKNRFRPNRKSGHEFVKGRHFYFEADSTRTTFDHDREKYEHSFVF